MFKLIIDNREKKSRIKRAYNYFNNKNYEIQIDTLKSGDYVFTDGKTNVAFEYKTIEDFNSSIKSNRVFNQAISMAETYPFHFIIIVGDYAKTAEKLYWNRIHISKDQLKGAICRLNTISTCIRVDNEKYAFNMMEKQTNKCFNAKPLLKHYNLPKSNPVMKYLIGFDHVGDETARSISETLNMKYLEDLLDLTEEKLINVDGIGEIRARDIMNQLRRDRNGNISRRVKRVRRKS